MPPASAGRGANTHPDQGLGLLSQEGGVNRSTMPILQAKKPTDDTGLSSVSETYYPCLYQPPFLAFSVRESIWPGTTLKINEAIVRVRGV